LHRVTVMEGNRHSFWHQREATWLSRGATLFAAGWLAAGCAIINPPVTNEEPPPPEIAQPAPPSPPPVAEPEPPASPPKVRQVSTIAPDTTALFFGATATRKELILRNDGNRAGRFALRLPDRAMLTGDEDVSFNPASGSIAPGETVAVMVSVVRDKERCNRALRLAVLETEQGTQSIGVNYVNTGSAKLEIVRSGDLAEYFEPGGHVIDFGKEPDQTAEFTVTNRGCAAGALTILKSGEYEESLAVPTKPHTLASGEFTVISLSRPDEKYFFGTRSVTLLVRQNDATVDNVEVRWTGLSWGQ